MANVALWIFLAFCVCIHLASATMINIAVGKPAGTARNPGRAVDGNLTTSSVVQENNWWWGDMGTVQDAVVNVFFGPEDNRIRTDVKLHTGNTGFNPPNGNLCQTVQGRTDGTDSPDITANCTGSWRYLVVSISTINELNLAEVVVSVCTNGTYSDSCSKLCSSRYCAGSSTACARYTGACSGGCQTGWVGTDCTDCVNGMYGAHCNKSCSVRHCAVASASCDRDNWACPPGGCTAGWTGTDCTTVCPSGTYGINCSHTCGNRHCMTSSVTCDPVTGQCDMGCTPGWNGTDCSKACPSGTYGQGCSSICGNCSDDTCNHVTGNCSGDCHAGWQGPLCEQACKSKTFGINCKEKCSHCNGTCDMVTGHCLRGCEKGYNGTKCETLLQTSTPGRTDSNVSAAVGGTVAAILVVIIIVTGFIVYRRRHSPAAKNYEQREESPNIKSGNEEGGNVYVNVAAALEPEEELPDEDEPSPSGDYYNESMDAIREVAVADLAATIQKIRDRKGGIEAEFNRLPAGFTAPYDESQKPENQGKNKFRGYYPYNNNRVRLSIIPDILGSDYINASHMHNYDKKKSYIASQAPNKKTVGDFWRMIWEHRCNRVIMLTGLVEATKVKCYKYWPDEDALETDHHKVEVEVTDKRANFTMRRLRVTSKKDKTKRTVIQYHYTSWPDHGVPDTLALVSFIWMIRRTDTPTEGPLLVHCSAGIGRTGAYIAVDSLIDQARETQNVDVFGFVSAMREERKNMIQTKEQYECVFQCLVEMTTFGNTSMNVEDFTTSYSSRGMDNMVNRKTIREITQMMISEERHDSPDQHSMWVDGNQKFIVKVGPTMRNTRGYLQAVTPPAGHEKLLWKLVEENNAQNIIIISPLQMEILGEKGATKTYGNATLKTTDVTNLSSVLSMVTLRLEVKDNGNCQDVRFFKFNGPLTIDGMSSCLLNHGHLQHLSSETFPVVIVHSEADRKCAVSFCIMGNIICGVMEDHRVDVIGHVRSFLKCCPDLTLTAQEVEKLQDFALMYIQLTQAPNTYANM